MSINIINPGLNFNGGFTYGNVPNKLVLHNADAVSCTIQDIHQWHLNNGWIGCGYHFFVRKYGSIYSGRPVSAVGAHCPGANANSIGICAEGKYISEAEMPAAQKNAIIALCKYLMEQYPAITSIYGHRDLYSTDCPGTHYPQQEIVNAVLNGGVVEVLTAATPVLNPVIIEQIKALQYDMNIEYNAGLKIDGVAGTSTQAALKGIENLLVKGHKSTVVSWIQQKLQGWGYPITKITGELDETTFQCITELQKNWQRSTSGKMSLETWTIFLNN